jgi:hypothetical protein
MRSTVLPTKFEPSPDALAAHCDHLQRKHGYFTMNMPFTLAITVIAQCQLALRHPANNGECAKEMRAILDQWIKAMDESSPGIARQLETGFDAQFDAAT